nr:bifunctional precorrin-2 dehydrogenase/sirohydrochlorin ferrochelatase [candidate division Zixibacteria bacterium]
MSATYMPISISLKNRHCLVVGGGKVALRKIENLLDYESEITVIAPEVHDKIEYFAGKGRLKIVHRVYQSPEAENYGLVISACDDDAVNRQVYEDCRAKGIPVNVVDNPPLCDFIFPAVVRRDALTISISTDGKAPFLSGHLRLILENMFQEERWTKIIKLAASFRKKIQSRWPDDHEKRTTAISRFLAVDWQQILKEKKSTEELESYLEELMEN